MVLLPGWLVLPAWLVFLALLALTPPLVLLALLALLVLLAPWSYWLVPHRHMSLMGRSLLVRLPGLGPLARTDWPSGLMGG